MLLKSPLLIVILLAPFILKHLALVLHVVPSCSALLLARKQLNMRDCAPSLLLEKYQTLFYPTVEKMFECLLLSHLGRSLLEHEAYPSCSRL